MRILFLVHVEENVTEIEKTQSLQQEKERGFHEISAWLIRTVACDSHDHVKVEVAKTHELSNGEVSKGWLGAVVSITIALFAEIDHALPGVGNVSTAFDQLAFWIVPPFKVNDEALLYSRSDEFSQGETV